MLCLPAEDHESLLIPHTKLTHAPNKLPCLPDPDQSILPDAQRRWATERATDSVKLPFDHCPHLSHPGGGR